MNYDKQNNMLKKTVTGCVFVYL